MELIRLTQAHNNVNRMKSTERKKIFGKVGKILRTYFRCIGIMS